MARRAPSFAGGGELDAARGIPGFEVAGEIGRGGMGHVYFARQLTLGRPVALKLIEPGDLDSPDLRKRLRREAEAAAKCQHPRSSTRRTKASAGDPPTYC